MAEEVLVMKEGGCMKGGACFIGDKGSHGAVLVVFLGR